MTPNSTLLAQSFWSLRFGKYWFHWNPHTSQHFIQFPLISISLFFCRCSHFKVASSMLAFFMVSSWATTAYIAFENNHIPNTDDPLALFDKIYDKPWTRLGPYLVGMCVGWFLFKTNCKIRMHRVSMNKAPDINMQWKCSQNIITYHYLI